MTPGGKQGWRPNGVISILTNEKYKGDAILQKKFTVDFLTKKQKVNEGEVPQYYVSNSHPAIIEPDMFDLVQYELAQRKASGRWTSSTHCFSGKIVCGECGGVYGSKVWHSNTQYRRVVWQCNEKHRGEKCQTAHLSDEQIRTAFLAAFNRLLDDKAEILAAYDEVIRVLTDNTALDAEISELKGECDVVMELIRKSVQENAQTALDQEEYNRRYAALTERYETACTRLVELDAQRTERTAKRAKITRFLKMLVKHGDIVTEFDEELWYITVDTVKVYADQRLVVTFKDGSEVKIEPEIWKAA